MGLIDEASILTKALPATSVSLHPFRLTSDVGQVNRLTVSRLSRRALHEEGEGELSDLFVQALGFYFGGSAEVKLHVVDIFFFFPEEDVNFIAVHLGLHSDHFRILCVATFQLFDFKVGVSRVVARIQVQPPNVDELGELSGLGAPRRSEEPLTGHRVVILVMHVIDHGILVLIRDV